MAEGDNLLLFEHPVSEAWDIYRDRFIEFRDRVIISFLWSVAAVLCIPAKWLLLSAPVLYWLARMLRYARI